MKLLIFVVIFFSFVWISEGASGHGTDTTWKVTDGHDTCIFMKATIGLNLSYVVQGGDAIQYVSIPVPDTVKVNNDLSSCGENINVNGTVLTSQILHLDFDSKSDPGWSIEFFFTQNKTFHASNTEFTLYRVGVTANYSTQPDKFKGYDTNSPIVNYSQPFDFSSVEPSVIADDIYANVHYSYFCDSSQDFPINTAESFGRTWSISLKKIQVQAFAPSGTTKFGDREICPQDQNEKDIVPVIVGAVLSVLVLITLIIYLVYRARQPPAVLYLTNPQSHFEDLGVMKAQREEEEEDGSEVQIGHPERVAKHLRENPPSPRIVYENAGYVD
ncbi:hypothetical protein FO519_004090 [Halicephalobus sp. NKZ332]|nr:hypothetical protein FO519_004090 [Halicephalobus sp. NKZ332]